MIFISLFALSVKYNLSDDPKSGIKCKGPHTFVNGTGKCECSADFPFGDPSSEIGCWTCNPPCDLNAHCYGPDQCRCNEGFIGDGLDVCEKPVPSLKNFMPKSGSVNGGEKVTLFISVNAPNYTAIKGFCRIGPMIYDAIAVNTTHIICITDKGKPGSFPVSASFDAVHWSTDNATFTYNADGATQVSIFFGLFTSFLIILLGYMIFYYLQKTDRFMEQADEVLPLTKWHMNTPHITPQAEQTWFDFLWNIIIE